MEIKNKKFEKLFKILSFFLIFILFCYFLYLKILPNYFPATIALLISLLGFFQNEIKSYFMGPIFDLKIREQKVGESSRWYNLTVKNIGLSSAKDIEVKIRDGQDKEWVNLKRPFYKKLEEDNLSYTKIDLLSKGQEEDFNIGSIQKEGNFFQIVSTVKPANQSMNLDGKEFSLYHIEIISRNVAPYFLKIKIKNDNYDNFKISNIELV